MDLEKALDGLDGVSKELRGKDYILQLFTQRKKFNPAYSLRAYARDLGLGKTTLNDYLSNKRNLSPKNCLKVAQRMKLTPLQKLTLNDPKKTRIEDRRILLNEDQFRLISRWYYFAILNLAKIKASRGTPAYIADRLGISEAEAQEALGTLMRMGLIAIEKGKLSRTSLPIETTQDVPSTFIREFHTSILQLGQAALSNFPVDKREFGTVIMAIDTSELQNAKNYLRKCKRRVSQMLEKEGAQEVYALSVQLFPLSISDSAPLSLEH